MRSALDLLSDSINFFTSHIQTLFSVHLVAGISATIYTVALVEPEQVEQAPGSYFIILFASTILIILIGIFSQVALLKVVSAPETAFNEAYAFSAGIFLRYLGTVIIVGVVIVLGFILFIIPGIIFSLWYACVPFVVLFENKTGLEAMRQSKEYVRGRIGSVFSRLIIMSILAIVFYALFLFCLSFVSITADSFVYAVLDTLALFVIGTIFSIFVYKLYLEIKRTYVPLTPALEQTAPVAQ